MGNHNSQFVFPSEIKRFHVIFSASFFRCLTTQRKWGSVCRMSELSVFMNKKLGKSFFVEFSSCTKVPSFKVYQKATRLPLMFFIANKKQLRVFGDKTGRPKRNGNKKKPVHFGMILISVFKNKKLGKPLLSDFQIAWKFPALN